MPKKITQHQARVREFQVKAGHPVREVPTMPEDPKERIRIVKLVIEEALELSRAMGVVIHSKREDTQYGATHLLCDGHTGPLHSEELETGLHFSAVDSRHCSLTEAADALADLSVVTYGGINALGLTDVSLLELIDRSNLEKFTPPQCPTCAEVGVQTPMELRPLEFNVGGGDPNCNVRTDERWVCTSGGSSHATLAKEMGPYRREDGKLVKGKNWQKPDVAGLLAEQSRSNGFEVERYTYQDFHDLLYGTFSSDPQQEVSNSLTYNSCIREWEPTTHSVLGEGIVTLPSGNSANLSGIQIGGWEPEAAAQFVDSRPVIRGEVSGVLYKGLPPLTCAVTGVLTKGESQVYPSKDQQKQILDRHWALPQIARHLVYRRLKWTNPTDFSELSHSAEHELIGQQLTSFTDWLAFEQEIDLAKMRSTQYKELPEDQRKVVDICYGLTRRNFWDLPPAKRIQILAHLLGVEELTKKTTLAQVTELNLLGQIRDRGLLYELMWEVEKGLQTSGTEGKPE